MSQTVEIDSDENERNSDLEQQIGNKDDAEGKIDFEPQDVIKTRGSLVWKYFHFSGTTNLGADKKKVYCKLCERNKKKGKKMSQIPYSGGTTNLTKHLKIWHKSEFKKAEEEASKKTDANKNSSIKDYYGEKTKHKWSKSSVNWKNATMSIAKWCAKNSRPAFIVEDSGFRCLMDLLCPQYEVPSAKTIGRYIYQLYELEHSRIKEKLKDIEFCAVTTDGGTSSNAVSFQDTNVQYINEEMYMKTHTLGVHENKEEHTADNYRENTDDVEDEFEIKEKVVMTVTDNENKMKKAFSKNVRSGCLAHILHSTVSFGIKQTPEVDNTIKKMRRIATKFNKSYAFKYAVEVQQKKRDIKVKPIHQDVPTRWGSTRASCESFLDTKKESDFDEDDENDVFGDDFENMGAINDALRKVKYKKPQKVTDFLLSRNDMLRIQRTHKFLLNIDIYSTILGGQKFVTGSIVLPVVASLKNLFKPDDEDAMYIANMKEEMLDDFKRRVADNLNGEFLLKATALDARFKNLKVTQHKEARDEIFNNLEKELRELIEKTPTQKDSEDNQEAPKKKMKIGLDFDESDEETEMDDIAKKEITAYRRELVQDREEDPLDWWRARMHLYPNLIRLVR
jgi:hypothetical protein